MRFIKYLTIIIIVLICIGYGVYYFGTNIASAKIIEVVSTELEESGEMENIIKVIESDPQLKAFIDDAKTVEEDELPFTTKEEATRVVIKKLGISGIQDIQSKVQQGEMTKEQLMLEVEKNFTEEEIAALKVIAYKEIYNK
ncbi:hypothetical protein [Oceanobacillus sp. CAU 1775]